MKSVSRNFSKTIASELVEVKPLGKPSCKLFYIDVVYREPNEKLKIPTFNEPRLKPIKLQWNQSTNAKRYPLRDLSFHKIGKLTIVGNLILKCPI